MTTSDTRTPLPDSWEARRAAGRQGAQDELTRLRGENDRLRFALDRVAHMTPGAAGASSAMDLHRTLKAIAESALAYEQDRTL